MPDPNEAIRSLYANPRMAAARATRLRIGDDAVAADLAQRFVRAERAHAAMGTRTRPAKRIFNRPPERSRQYARPMATTVFRDTRMSSTAKVAAAMIRAMCGRAGFCNTTYATVASRIGRSRSTGKRVLAELRAGGYIALDVRYDWRGRAIGITILILKDLLPFFETSRKIPTAGPELPPTNTKNFKKEKSDRRGLWISGPHGFDDKQRRQRYGAKGEKAP